MCQVFFREKERIKSLPLNANGRFGLLDRIFCLYARLSGGENVAYRYISLDGRRKIASQYRAGARPADIASAIGVSTATVYRELQRGYTGETDENKRLIYDPMIAQEAVQNGFRRRGRKRRAKP